MKKTLIFLVLVGSLALFFGSANPIMHFPLVVLFYPAALFLLARKTASGKNAFILGWITGTIGASMAMYWLVVPVREYAFFPWILAIPVPICMGMYIGFYGGLFAYFVHKTKNMPEYFQILFTFFLWFALEWFRSWFLTGFTWLNLSASSAAFPVLIQGVSLVGMHGLSALFACLACACASRKQSIQLLGLLSLILVIGLGYMRISEPLVNKKEARFILVQGNLSQAVKWNPEMQQATVDKYLKLSEEALIKAKENNFEITALLYPETAMPFFIQDSINHKEELYNFAKKYNVSMLVGGISYNLTAFEREFFNSLFLIEPDISFEELLRNEVQTYSKQHLLPFGEYVPPFLDFKILEPLLSGLGGFTQQKNQKNLILNENISIGSLICYEATFPELAQEQVANGALLLINVSNDAWYGHTSAAKQHLDISLLRAVEQNRYLIRSTNTGISAAVNPYGQIMKSTALFKDVAIQVNVGYRNEHTVYHKIKPYLSYFINLLFLLFLCITYTINKRQKNL